MKNWKLEGILKVSIYMCIIVIDEKWGFRFGGGGSNGEYTGDFEGIEGKRKIL